MANEWVKVDGVGTSKRFTCASGVAITKGTLLTLSDPRTAAAIASTRTAALLTPIAGVAAMDKDSTDSSTSISVWQDGIFEAKCSGAIEIGAACVGVGLNCIAQCPAATIAASGAAILGYALEAGAADETINVRLRL